MNDREPPHTGFHGQRIPALPLEVPRDCEVANLSTPRNRHTQHTVPAAETKTII